MCINSTTSIDSPRSTVYEYVCTVVALAGRIKKNADPRVPGEAANTPLSEQRPCNGQIVAQRGIINHRACTSAFDWGVLTHNSIKTSPPRHEYTGILRLQGAPGTAPAVLKHPLRPSEQMRAGSNNVEARCDVVSSLDPTLPSPCPPTHAIVNMNTATNYNNALQPPARCLGPRLGVRVRGALHRRGPRRRARRHDDERVSATAGCVVHIHIGGWLRCFASG